MPMEIIEEVKGRIAVLRVTGELISGPEVAPFHTSIKRLAEAGRIYVVVDFSEVAWFGSAMLGVMAASFTTLQSVGGDIRLAGLNEKNKSIIEISRLDNVFQCMETVDEALESFEVN